MVFDHLLCGETFMDVRELLSRVQSKSRKDAQSGRNEYANEHKLLNELIPRFTIGDCAAGHRAENRGKNRNSLVVPPDASRPYLTSFQNNENTDYINAVFVDGYRRADEFVCTEWPMASTLANFWSMVYDHDIKTVVVLNHPRPGREYPQFWPEGGAIKRKSYGPVFCVEEVESEEHHGGRFKVFQLNLMKQEMAPHKYEVGISSFRMDQLLLLFPGVGGALEKAARPQKI